MPMGGENMPPMGMGDESQEMNPDMGMESEMPDDGEGMPSEFGGNFDAGVEADEETDPKKYIQQLTGKLSQSLNSYNNENGEPDTELGKYVLVMLVKQGVKGMDEKDKKEIIKKINSDDSEDVEMPEDEGSEGGDDNSMEDESPEMNEMPMESKIFKVTKKQLFENFGLAISDETPSLSKKVIDTKITSDTKKNKHTIPFEAPKKFKK
jgi:hypothetical protein